VSPPVVSVPLSFAIEEEDGPGPSDLHR
jgi:hypothetical protein